MPEKKDFIVMFKAESDEHLNKLDKGILALEKKPDDLELIQELNRQAHTLKGSARVFGFYEIQEIAHKIEALFDKVGQKKIVFNSLLADKIFKGLDAIRVILGKIVKEERIDVDVSQICKELENLITPQVLQRPQAPSKEKPQVVEKEEPQKVQAKKVIPQTKKESQDTKKQVIEDRRGEVVEEYIRVPLGRVNKLLNLTGEMVINKMKSSSKVVQAKKLSRMAKAILKRVSDLGERMKKEFPIENSEIPKLISECNAGLQRLRDEAFDLYDKISNEIFHLDPVIDELQNRMKEIRMLPCSTIFEGFLRMVRDIASQEGKVVNLEITGEETELDKRVLEGVKPSLIHILRNSIDHGIENPEERSSLGKPRYGTIKISALHEGGNAVIVIEDDGRGLDTLQIGQTALKKRLVSPQELEAMSEKEILNLIFMNGYSTSTIITDISGRGLGLDIVRCDVENLKGKVFLDTQKGKGTKFTLFLPLTIAIIQVLLIKQNEKLFSFSMSSILESLEVDMKDVSTIEGKMAAQIRDHTVPLVRLNEILDIPHSREETSEGEGQGPQVKSRVPVIIASSFDKRVGFIVDEIVGEEEIFIKSLGEHLGKVKNVSGATILGTGEVVIILDVADLIAQSQLSHPVALGRKSIPIEKRKEKRVLVVDDALSTRELMKSILESEGYFVDTAVDGLDALDKLVQTKCDIIVCDIQMPRMDGFQLCSTLKQNDELKSIPVVIVTAKDKEEDKRRGIEVGAAAYILKKSFDQTNLLDIIERIIG